MSLFVTVKCLTVATALALVIVCKQCEMLLSAANVFVIVVIAVSWQHGGTRDSRNINTCCPSLRPSTCHLRISLKLSKLELWLVLYVNRKSAILVLSVSPYSSTIVGAACGGRAVMTDDALFNRNLSCAVGDWLACWPCWYT